MTDSPEPAPEPAPGLGGSTADRGGSTAVGRSGRVGPGGVVRSVASAVLLVLGCVLVPVSVVTVWVHAIVLDTDRYVETVEPLAADPDIEAAVQRRIVQAVDVRLDSERVTAELAAWMRAEGAPPRATGAVRALAPSLDAAVAGLVDGAAARFVASDQFEKLWTAANRRAHSAVVHALTGKGRGPLGVAEGTVTLDVGTAVDQAKKELVDAGVTPAERIPRTDKQLVLFHSDELDQVQDGARALDEAGRWLPLVTVALVAAGVLLARRRRRALAKAALGAAAAGLLVLVALVVARRYYLDHLPSRLQSDAAAGAAYDTLLRFPRVTLRTVAVLGVAVALGAYAAGPGRFPRAVRATAERTADATARWADTHGVRTGRAGTWTADHERWLTLAVVLVPAVAFALWNHPTVGTVLWLALVLLAALALLAVVAASGRRSRGVGAGRGG